MTTTGSPILDPTTDTALRSLDPAGPAADVHGTDAQALLARIVATDPAAGLTSAEAGSAASGRAGDTATADTPRRPMPMRRRLVLAGAAVAGAVAFTIVPGLGGSSPAFAGWTATPSGVQATDLASAAAGCKDYLGRALPPAKPGEDPNMPTAADVFASTPVIAERRGDWTFVLMASAEFEVSCLTSGRSYGSGAIDPARQVSLKPREALVTSVGASTFDSDGYLSVNGRVGSEIIGVTVHADGTDVRATVKSGRFLAWWPEKSLRDKSSPFPSVRLSLTFVDGKSVDLTAEQSAPLSGHGSSRG